MSGGGGDGSVMISLLGSFFGASDDEDFDHRKASLTEERKQTADDNWRVVLRGRKENEAAISRGKLLQGQSEQG